MLELLRSIWNFGSGFYLNEEREKISTIIIDIHTMGKFADLITMLGKEYPEFTDLLKDLRRSGSFSPSYVATLFLQNDKLNMHDIRVRLVYMISCLRAMDWVN